MNGIEKVPLILADSMEDYVATPDPYKNAPDCKVDILELSRYARKTGRKIIDLSPEEILRFKVG